jgi:hypothetical protein
VTVRRPFYFWLAVATTLPLAYFLIDRIDFALSSRTVAATVAEISARNSGCTKSRYDCTVFDASLRYRVGESRYQISVSAGTAREHNQPTSAARFYVNELVSIVYDARDPARAYLNTFWAVWSAPFLTFNLHRPMWCSSLQEKRRSW